MPDGGGGSNNSSLEMVAKIGLRRTQSSSGGIWFGRRCQRGEVGQPDPAAARRRTDGRAAAASTAAAATTTEIVAMSACKSRAETEKKLYGCRGKRDYQEKKIIGLRTSFTRLERIA